MFRKLQAPLLRLFNRSKKENKIGEIKTMNSVNLYNTNISDQFLSATPKRFKNSCDSSFISLKETPKARPPPFVKTIRKESIYETVENIEQHERLKAPESKKEEVFPFYCDIIKRRLIFIEAKLFKTKRQLRKEKSRSIRALPQLNQSQDHTVEVENELLNLVQEKRRTRRELRHALRQQQPSLIETKPKLSYKLYPAL